MLRSLHDDIVFEGVGGPAMIESGFDSWIPMEQLSVMGIVEVLMHLPDLIKTRRDIAARWIEHPPDVFIGIDAPDFNLGLEQRLHEAGIPTVHYVCPSIWAWREGRVNTLKKATDLVMCLFPFEVPLLQQHGIRAEFVGHPLGQEMQQVPEKSAVRQQLDVPDDRPTLALLPGSRLFEAKQLSRCFLDVASRVAARDERLLVLVPLATDAIKQQFLKAISKPHGHLDIRFFDGRSREVMAAADVVLLASGTATLEALLLEKPMVVAYRVHWLSHFLTFGIGLVKTPFIALPNILAGRPLVPELFQKQCTADNLAKQVLMFFTRRQKRQALIDELKTIKSELAENRLHQAAQSILKLAGS